MNRTAIVLLLGVILVGGIISLIKKPHKAAKTAPPPAAVVTVPPPVVHKPAAGPMIAIVIDDVGNTLKNMPAIEGIKNYPVTFSIIPGLVFSNRAENDLTAMGFEVMLHLPMEPKENTRLEKNTILVSMNEEQIKTITRAALDSLPQAKGINNHMGSKVTEDEKALSSVLDVLKERRVFFLDSFVTGKSAGEKVAARKQVKFIKRDIFLDNIRDPEYIRHQLGLLKQKARQKGQAVGIGHDRKTTLEVLGEELPRMEQEGYKLVYVSELAKVEKTQP